MTNINGPVPNVMKIDVEGFEDEVLAGMPRILADRHLRAIFLESSFRVAGAARQGGSADSHSSESCDRSDSISNGFEIARIYRPFVIIRREHGSTD